MATNEETIRALLRALASLISAVGEDSRMTYKVSKVLNDLARASSTGEPDKTLKDAAPELSALADMVKTQISFRGIPNL